MTRPSPCLAVLPCRWVCCRPVEEEAKKKREKKKKKREKKKVKYIVMSHATPLFHTALLSLLFINYSEL